MNVKNVYIAHTNCITPLGFDVDSNVKAIAKGVSGISLQENSSLMAAPFYAGVIDNDKLNTAFAALSNATHTRLGKMIKKYL